MLWRLGLALTLCANISVSAELELLSRTKLVSDGIRFGGLSGIEVIDGGNMAWLLSDRGRVFAAPLPRFETLLAAPELEVDFLGYTGGDTEGLAYVQPGEWYVSLEAPAGVHRLWQMCTVHSQDFEFWRRNKALEAIAVLPDQSLITIPEKPDAVGFPVFHRKDGHWTTAFYLSPEGGFVPVGADMGPDGWLYLLERRFGLWGFQSRIIRLQWSDPTRQETLLETAPATFDNLEGISVWTDAQGRTRLTLVSDDNFMPFLRGELVEFALIETLATAANDR